MFKIITDNGADLPIEYMKKNDIGCMYLSTILDNKVIAGENIFLSAEEFYRMLREGAKPTTSQINPENAREYFEEHINESDEFLYVGLSSGLSGTVESVIIGANEVMEAHPDKTIEIVDSLTGSPGEGLLVYYAVKMRDEGKSLSETAQWLRENARHVLLAITVDDLFDLWRGGRVSRSSAAIGSLVAIKPFIIADNEGHLQVVKKLRGRKKSLDYIVDYMAEHMGSYADANRTIAMVNHGNAAEDAEYTARAIKDRFGFENIMMSNVGPMIGTHTGPSIVVAAFLGEERS